MVSPCQDSSHYLPSYFPLKSPPPDDHRIHDADYVERSIERKLNYANVAMREEEDNDEYTTTTKLISRAVPFKRNEMESKSATIGNIPYTICQYQGDRPHMEDFHVATEIPFMFHGTSKSARIFGILDGHGGTGAAEFVKNEFSDTFNHHLVLLQQKYSDWNLDTIIWNALKLTFVNLSDRYQYIDGTTATITLIIDDVLWTANAGDSRAFLVQNDSLIALSEDMKPAIFPTDLVSEQDFEEMDDRALYCHYTKRILNRKGCILIPHDGRPPCIKGKYGVLNVGGAIGDHGMQGICARPAITRVRIEKDAMLYIGCDGVFDAASSRQVRETGEAFANDLQKMSEAIVASAYMARSPDNISAMVVKLS